MEKGGLGNDSAVKTSEWIKTGIWDLNPPCMQSHIFKPLHSGAGPSWPAQTRESVLFERYKWL